MNKEIILNKHTCATHGCGITFWLEEGFEARRRADKEDFYCPNGHSLVYGGETAEQKLARVIREKNEELRIKDAEIERLSLKRQPKRRRRAR